MTTNSLNFIDQEEKESGEFIINETIEDSNYLNQEISLVTKNKWVAFALCFFLGILGAHKFYEGKIGSGVLYFFTSGILGIGVILDLIALLRKPTIYYVDNNSKYH